MKEIKYNCFSIIEGNSNIIISAPHTYTHKRKGKKKSKELGVLDMVLLLKELTNCHVIYTTQDINNDPNFDKKSEYKDELIKYIEEKDIEYLIDIHGTKVIKTFDVEIGTNNLKNINNDKDLLKKIVKIFKNNSLKKVKIDNIFKSSLNTVCHIVNKETSIKTLQFEISKKYRLKRNKHYNEIINSLFDIISYLEKREKLDDIDFEKRYDTLLEIKPSYGYNRELKPVMYNEIGLELEIAVNYDRNSYSFIRKMLKKIKDLVADNGYFVKDGTVLGDYSFEIVLDPMSIDKIYDLYNGLMEIISFSKGKIEMSSDKKCGIHLNFNKFDIRDLFIAHKKITSFVIDNPKYFDENIYKQFKFLWNYDKYLKYQENVSDKYLWINYLKSKVIEVRNIKAGISPEELVIILSNILKCLYYDKEEQITTQNTYLTLEKLYDIAFEKNRSEEVLYKLNSDGYILISLNDNKASIVDLPDEIKEQIKEYIDTLNNK